MANALSGPGIKPAGEPNEGKINLVAESDGLLKIDREALTNFNMLGDVMCATVHNDSLVRKGQRVAGTRAIPLVVKKTVVIEAVRIAENSSGIVSLKKIRKPKTGIVITGNEVYHGRIDDAFEPVIRKKIDQFNGEIIGVQFAPDDATLIENEIRALISSGADLIITTGGMSVDPDDVTRFAIKNLGVEEIPILGIPACGMYASITVFDLVLPRVLTGEKIGRRELAELGHGGLCLKCDECRYPVCPFGK
jgi:molybdenum cofactor synthesis domain-containing protein